MRTWHSRYVFTDFRNLQKVKLKKLQRVCDRIYVFIHAEETEVPLRMVRQMQKWGKRLKWIVVDGAPVSEMNYHIAFYLGKLHGKADPHIEFAILSNDEDFDSLIQFVNAQGRSCIRVRTRKKAEHPTPSAQAAEEGGEAQNGRAATLLDEVPQVVPRDKPTFTEVTMEMFGGVSPMSMRAAAGTAAATDMRADFGYSETMIERTAEDTLRRLVRSGNRPAELETLKEYIMLHNEEVASEDVIEKVVQKLEAREAITVKGDEVIYHF